MASKEIGRRTVDTMAVQNSAVCLYSLELIEQKHNQAHVSISPGSIGENLTLARGRLEGARVTDARIEVGEVLLEVARAASPCRRDGRHRFTMAYSLACPRKCIPGWSRFYARVLREGLVTAGDFHRSISAPPRLFLF